jgi:indole-3-glycerol phosphate synthase
MNRLTPIVEARRDAVTAACLAKPVDLLLELAEPVPKKRDFRSALEKPGLSVIAEVKRRSPSAGGISPNAEAPQVASRYARAAASAISVLTEPEYFGGSLQDLIDVRTAQPCPVLRKDFIIDPYQITESRAAGADAILLIVAILNERTVEFLELAREQNLDALVEIHSEDELRIALDAGADVIGVNNRSLEDLTIDLGTAEHLLPLIPSTVTSVAESGLHGRDDTARMQKAGAKAILVGTALMEARDPGMLIAEFQL